jgi:hypothetical protein
VHPKRRLRHLRNSIRTSSAADEPPRKAQHPRLKPQRLHFLSLVPWLRRPTFPKASTPARSAAFSWLLASTFAFCHSRLDLVHEDDSALPDFPFDCIIVRDALVNMGLVKRYCVEYVDGTVECFRDGFWYTDVSVCLSTLSLSSEEALGHCNFPLTAVQTGIIIKWSILAAIFFLFMAWFVGGYIHAKRRMRKGLPLMAYHRWLVPYSERKKWGQVPQNHFTFYTAQPYQVHPRPDGTYPEPPPMYNQDMPPGYVPPPGATKMAPNQTYMEMPRYPAPAGPYPTTGQESGVVGGGQDEHMPQQELPPRPAPAKVALNNLLGRFRK